MEAENATAQFEFPYLDPSGNCCLRSWHGRHAGWLGYLGLPNRSEQGRSAGWRDPECSCELPCGQKVLGGGFDIETPDEVKVFSSEPTDGHGNIIDNGWDVMVHNIDTQSRQTTAIAICAQ
jgi:hypothetical protein